MLQKEKTSRHSDGWSESLGSRAPVLDQEPMEEVAGVVQDPSLVLKVFNLQFLTQGKSCENPKFQISVAAFSRPVCLEPQTSELSHHSDHSPSSPPDSSTCTMSEWVAWSPCSASCGPGSRTRSRYMTQFPDDGSPCSLPTEETDGCVVNDECCEFRLSVVPPLTSHGSRGLSYTCPRLRLPPQRPAVAWLPSGPSGTPAAPPAALA